MCGFRVKTQVSDKILDSCLRFWLGICFCCSYLGFGFEILVLHSGFGFSFVIKVWGHVGDSGLGFRLGIRVWVSGLGFRFYIQV